MNGEDYCRRYGRITNLKMSELRELADGLWIIDGKSVRWFTMPFPTRMTIIRLNDGELFVHSPIDLTSELREIVDGLGVPRYFVSPNKLHHLFLGQWQRAYQKAHIFAPPGLRKKCPDLAFHDQLGDGPNPAWEQEIDQLIFKGSKLVDEVVFFHKSSRTVIFGDLIENFDPKSLSPFQRMVARFGGVLAPHGQTPVDWRLSFRAGRDDARQSLRKLREWRPSAVIMCHGIPIFEDAMPFIDSAFAWLEEAA